jgi:glutathione S-transferase
MFQHRRNTMIELYASGPHFGLPDPSPFVVKAMMLFKVAGIPFEAKEMSFRQAPKSKIPYLRDGDIILGDSHFMARHLETAHKADLSGGYGAKERALGWAMARMMEEHFYFLNVHERWMPDHNFNIGPRRFFDAVPAPLRPLIVAMIRRKVRNMLKGQGLGRHTDAERLELAKGDVSAVETLLGAKAYILGDRVSEADACVFPFLLSAQSSHFTSPIGDHIRSRPVIMNYIRNMQAEFFPEFPL